MAFGSLKLAKHDNHQSNTRLSAVSQKVDGGTGATDWLLGIFLLFVG